jgi:hypothetical protein
MIDGKNSNRINKDRKNKIFIVFIVGAFIGGVAINYYYNALSNYKIIDAYANQSVLWY